MHRSGKLFTIILCFFCLGCSPATNPGADVSFDEKERLEKTDDWLFIQGEINREKITGKSMKGQQAVSAANAMTSTKSIPMMAAPVRDTLGFAVGGAKDTGNFSQNLQKGFLPKYHSITYEGLFYDYYFDTGVGMGSCKNLFCPSYSKAVVPDMFSGKPNYYLSVGLNSSLTEESFSRKKLNLVIVLDISGSMGGRFDRYYYDRSKTSPSQEAPSDKTKMQLANEAIVSMMQHLKTGDRFGVVLFDNNSYRAKPLSLVEHTDMKAIAGHIMEIRPQGGTNWQAGYQEGIRLYSSLESNYKDPMDYENRIIFLTDAMPNLGELREEGLFDMVRKASDDGIYTSFIGVGIDCNPELVEYVTKTPGANYFSVHSAREFRKTLADEFDFMVTPLVFDLELTVKSDNYTIDGVFGSPEASLATGTVMKIKTLFPSTTEDNQVKGGVVLVKLKNNENSEAAPVELTVRYKDRNGKWFTITDTVSFTKKDYGYANKGIRKAILLTEYVSLIKNWLLDQNKGCNDQLTYPIPHFLKHGLMNPENRKEQQMISHWEKKSCPLEVSDGYRKLFTLFRKQFRKESEIIDDHQLVKELKILDTLIGSGNQTAVDHGEGLLDDWQIVK